MTRWLTWTLSLLTGVVVLGSALLLLLESLPAWRHSGLGFLTGTRWFFRASEFGAAPMVYGTLVVAVLALGLAAPLAFGAALFTAEVLRGRARLAVKGTIELLAGIPSVVYGLLGVLLLRDWIYRLLSPFDPLSGDTLLTGGVLLAVMILPTVTTLADDSLAGVPAGQRRAARGLGLTRAEVAATVVVPQAAPGLVAALLLGLGRALGETIAVFLVVGRRDNQWPEWLLSPKPIAEAGQTLTTKLGGSEVWIAWGDPLHWGAIVGLALLLLSLVVGLTVTGLRLAPPGGRDA